MRDSKQLDSRGPRDESGVTHPSGVIPSCCQTVEHREGESISARGFPAKQTQPADESKSFVSRCLRNSQIHRNVARLKLFQVASAFTPITRKMYENIRTRRAVMWETGAQRWDQVLCSSTKGKTCILRGQTVKRGEPLKNALK